MRVQDDRKSAVRRLAVLLFVVLAPILALTAYPARADAAPTVSWSTAASAGRPPALTYAASAYDSATGDVVLFGGAEANGTLSDETWLYDGRSWKEATPFESPPARELASLAFDPSTNPPELILFGGRGSDGSLLGDTWAWNGQSWNEQPYCGPSPREAAAMAYDRTGSLVLFGGTGMATPAPGCSGQSGESAEPNGGVGPTVALGDTWQWNGTTWQQDDVPGPPARSGAAMAWDSTDSDTVLFSGSTSPSSAIPALSDDTWVWSGSSWTQVVPSNGPPARYGAILADEPTVAGVVLATGEAAKGPLADAWIWAGGTWTEAVEASAPAARTGATAAAVPATWVAAPVSGRRRLPSIVVFGGTIGGGGVVAWTHTLLASPPPPPPPTTPATTIPGQAPASTTTVTSLPKASPVTTTTIPARLPSAATAPVNLPKPTMSTVGSTRRTLQAGDRVTLSGDGFRPLSTVAITFHSVPVLLGMVSTDMNGHFRMSVTVPSGAVPGQHHFVASGISYLGTSAQVETAVTVVGSTVSRQVSGAAKAGMVGAALAVPGAAWLTLSLRGRRKAALAGRPQSP